MLISKKTVNNAISLEQSSFSEIHDPKSCRISGRSGSRAVLREPWNHPFIQESSMKI